MVLAYEQAKFSGRMAGEGFHRILAEMTASGVVVGHFDRSGRVYNRGAVRWFCVDGRTGPPKVSERDIEGRLYKFARKVADREDFCLVGAELAARGVRVDKDQGWFTAGPFGLAGPMPSLDRKRSRSRSRSRRRRRGSSRRRRESSRSRSRSRSRPRSRKRSRKQSKSPKAAAPSAAPGLDEQRPTRRHLVAAAPSEASSSDGS